MIFLPQPSSLSYGEGTFTIHYDSRIFLDSESPAELFSAAQLLQQEIETQTGFRPAICRRHQPVGSHLIYLTASPELSREAYTLAVTPKNITICGSLESGVLYGVQTLRQMIRQAGAVLPTVLISDKPAMENRGFYHDATRGRVPTLSYLKQLADTLSFYKINQLQLYIEHSYLFDDLTEMWRDDTAPFSFYDRQAHHTLDITNPESLSLAKHILSEYMQLFSSKYFNLCADETFDLGKGASRALAEEKGTTVIYTEFVTELANYITESGHTPMFWSDVISQEPEVYHLLPKNLICLHWDYASNVSSERLTRLANSGAEHLYVCPGVQGWNQLINKYHEAYENISRMARYGHERHAMGLLNTDWGDYGHINHPDFSRIGMIYGAAFSWNADILPEEEINRQISVLEFGDASGKLVSVLDLLCHQDAYPWRTAVMVQEALELHQDKEEAAELLRSCAEGDADAANASIDALCAVLYEKAGTVRPENRPMIYAYLLAADGLKVLNRLLPFLRASLLSEGTLPEKEDCFALAGDLERWLHSYKELWRTVSKESELYRIAHVFCWYADLLRDLNA